MAYKIIDDSYTSNSAGFNAALEQLVATNAENKILITKGLMEVGSELPLIYQNLAANIVESTTQVITTDKDLVFICEKM